MWCHCNTMAAKMRPYFLRGSKGVGCSVAFFADYFDGLSIDRFADLPVHCFADRFSRCLIAAGCHVDVAKKMYLYLLERGRSVGYSTGFIPGCSVGRSTGRSANHSACCYAGCSSRNSLTTSYHGDTVVNRMHLFLKGGGGAGYSVDFFICCSADAPPAAPPTAPHIAPHIALLTAPPAAPPVA